MVGERLNLDAIQARADAAMNLEGETDAYIVAGRWSQAARDVPALVAEVKRLRDGHEMHEANHLRIIERAQAELRAARAVRDEVSRLYEDDRITLDDDKRLLRLLAAWDQAAREVTS